MHYSPQVEKLTYAKKYHNEGILKKYKPKLQIGSLDSKPQPKKEEQAPPTPPKTPELTPKDKKQAEHNEREVPRVLEPEAESGFIAPQPGPAAIEHKEASEQFGEMIPYADPSWYQTVGVFHCVNALAID